MNDAYTVLPLSQMRKIIAARMVEAKRTIPHFRVVADIETDALNELRERIRRDDQNNEISLNDLMIKACAMALMETPAVNLQWADNEIRQFHSADISVVVAVPEGLSTPIVRDAQVKPVAAISREIKDLVARASRNALRMEEVFGGSFSVSNLGMYGVDAFDAIINAPQCAVLALGCAKPKYVVSRERKPRVATVLQATLSVDHRAIDGVTAARFLSVFRNFVEQPEALMRERP